MSLSFSSATRNGHSDISSQTSDTVESSNKFIRWMRWSIKSRNKETQLERKLRRTFSRDPEAILQRYRPRESSPRQLDIEIQGTDTPPITCTAPDSAYMASGNSLLYITTNDSGYYGSGYSGMSGVSQNHGPHRMPRFGDSSHLSLHSNPSYPHQAHSMQSTDSGYSNGHQMRYYPTAIHSPHSVINQQPQAHGSYPDSKSLPRFQCINCGHSNTFSFAPHLSQYPYPSYPQHPASKPPQPIGSEQAHSILSSHSGHSNKGFGRQSPASIHSQHIKHPSPHMQPIPVYQPALSDPLSSLPILPHPSGAYVVYPQSQPIQPLRSERANSTLSSHSGNSHKGSGRRSPASVHSQHIQHPSPHMQPIPVYQPALQSQFISPSDLAIVQFALMHNRHCQIPGCCCQAVRELLEGARGGNMLPYHYDSPEARNGRRVHRVNHQISSTDSDSDYTHTERRSRAPNLRLLRDEHNRNPNLHLYYHRMKKSHMHRVNPSANHRRSKSLSDLTPLREVPETPVKIPAIGGSVIDTPVYYCPPTIGEDGQEKPTSPIDRCCTNQPMLLRQISISADNIPVLGSSLHNIMPSRRSASPYETVVHRENGIVTETTEC